MVLWNICGIVSGKMWVLFTIDPFVEKRFFLVETSVGAPLCLKLRSKDGAFPKNRPKDILHFNKTKVNHQ